MTEQFNLAKMRSFYEHDAYRSGRELAYGRLDIILKELRKRVVHNIKDKKILDIGISDGYLMRRISDMGFNTYGIDIAFSMIRLAKQSYPDNENIVHLTQGSVTNLPFIDNCFSMVMACEILEHLDEDSLLRALEELYRVLIPGGYIFATTPYNEQISNTYIKCPDCGFIFPPSGHYSSFDENKWQYYIIKTGFSKINFKNIYGTDFRLRKFNFFSPLIGFAARLFSVDSLTKMFVIIRK